MENNKKQGLLFLLVGASFILQGFQGVLNLLFENWVLGDYYLAPFDFLFSPVFVILGITVLRRWRYAYAVGEALCFIFLALHIFCFLFDASPTDKEQVIFGTYFFYYLFCIFVLLRRFQISFNGIRFFLSGIRTRRIPILLVTFVATSLILSGLANILYADWLRGVLGYAPEGFFLSLVAIAIGLSLLFRWRPAKKLTLIWAWAYLALSISEFVMAGADYLSHRLIPAVYSVWSVLFIIVLRARSIKAIFSENTEEQ